MEEIVWSSEVRAVLQPSLTMRPALMEHRPNGLVLSRSAPIDREGSRADSRRQHRADLSQRIAASGGSACWTVGPSIALSNAKSYTTAGTICNDLAREAVG